MLKALKSAIYIFIVGALVVVWAISFHLVDGRLKQLARADARAAYLKERKIDPAVADISQVEKAGILLIDTKPNEAIAKFKLANELAGFDDPSRKAKLSCLESVAGYLPGRAQSTMTTCVFNLTFDKCRPFRKEEPIVEKLFEDPLRFLSPVAGCEVRD
jgi:hypothetical protein